MAAFYQDFTSARTTEPHPETLLAQLRALDASAGVQHVQGTPAYTVKKGTLWTAPQIATAQNTIDTAPATTAQLIAQFEIDHWPISMRAFAEAVVDEFNVIRTQIGLPARTPAQVLTAIRNKAGTLS